MKIKPMVVIVFLLFFSLIYWYFKDVYGWKEFRKNTDTPNEYLNYTVINKENYSKDSIAVLSQLRKFLERHEDFFYSKAYFDSTELIIDSILYSPNFNKLAVFVISKNPTSRKPMPNEKFSWYYDATCYLGVRQNDTIALSWIGPVFTNSSNSQDISNDIREACLRTFVTKDTLDAYSYNMNDLRFWDSIIWDKIKKEAIERGKRNYPENDHSLKIK